MEYDRVQYSFLFAATSQLNRAPSSLVCFPIPSPRKGALEATAARGMLNCVMKRTRSPPQYQLRPRKTYRASASLRQSNSDSTSDEDDEYGDATFLIDEESSSDASKPSPRSESIHRASVRGGRKSRRTEDSAEQHETATAEKTSGTLRPPPNSLDSFSASEVQSLQDKLLSWYAKHHRQFPWRKKPARLLRETDTAAPAESVPESAAGEPYAVWISEIMSQQTRIEVVVGYFTRWMIAFPTLRALADAPMERVNELWAGLGYYRRARFLHEGARQIVSTHNGVIPSEASELRKIRGIGQYTSGAIASISFGRPEPAVDGNVERVLSRLRPGVAEFAPSAKPAVRTAAFDKLARQVLADVESPGDFNQALMELGATVCKPRGALCSMCPVRALCGAHAEAVKAGATRPEEYVLRYPIKNPLKRVKVRSETVAVCVACIKKSRTWQFFITQRQGTGLLSGLWEAPNTVVEVAASEGVPVDIFEGILLRSAGKALGRANVMSLDVLGVEWRDAARVTHIFSHIRQTLIVKVAILSPKLALHVEKTGDIGEIPFQWSSATEMMEKALSTQMLKVFRSAGKVIGQKFLKTEP